MLLSDKLYGDFKIDKVLEELIKSKPIQRLKGIEVIDFFMHPLNIYGYDQLTKILKVALANNNIKFSDFLREDRELIFKISKSKNGEIQELWHKLQSSLKVIEDEEDFDIHLKNKVRLIDPSIFY